jgi:hypothetical protein
MPLRRKGTAGQHHPRSCPACGGSVALRHGYGFVPNNAEHFKLHCTYGIAERELGRVGDYRDCPRFREMTRTDTIPSRPVF